MKLLSLAAAALFVCAGSAAAQSCGTLAVSGGPTTPIVFQATSLAANSPAVLLIGPNTGTTSFRLGPIATLTLGLEMPFVPVLLGSTDAAGAAGAEIQAPPRMPEVRLHAQAFSVQLPGGRPGPGGPPTLSFCTTNVVSFLAGGGS